MPCPSCQNNINQRCVLIRGLKGACKCFCTQELVDKCSTANLLHSAWTFHHCCVLKVLSNLIKALSVFRWKSCCRCNRNTAHNHALISNIFKCAKTVFVAYVVRWTTHTSTHTPTQWGHLSWGWCSNVDLLVSVAGLVIVCNQVTEEWASWGYNVAWTLRMMHGVCHIQEYT